MITETNAHVPPSVKFKTCKILLGANEDVARPGVHQIDARYAEKDQLRMESVHVESRLL